MDNEYSNEVEKYLKLILNRHYSKSSIHGVEHVKRTLILAMQLLDKERIEEEEDRKLIAYACIYHDLGRDTDGIDVRHGYISWKKIMKMKLLEEIPLSKEYKKILKFIIVNHCIADVIAENELRSYDILDNEKALYLYRLFKDADALDRVRINDLKPELLRLTSSLELIPLALHMIHESKSDIKNRRF